MTDTPTPAPEESPLTLKQEARLAAAQRAAAILRGTSMASRAPVDASAVIKLAYWIINAPKEEGAHR